MLVKLGVTEQTTIPRGRSQCRTNQICIYKLMLIKIKDNLILSDIGRNVVCDAGAVLTLPYVTATLSVLGHCTTKKKPMQIYWKAARGGAMRMIRGLENWNYEKRLKEWGLFSLEMRRLNRDMITVLQYIKGYSEEGSDQLFSR